jgi:hypothetical protein
MGRYKETYPKLLIEHLKEGYTFGSFAAVVGCNPKTLWDWVQKHEAFKDAKEQGLQYRSMYWQEKLKDRANTSTSAVLAGLRSADPENFKEKKEINHNNNVVFQITTGVPRLDDDEVIDLDDKDFRELRASDKGDTDELLI